MEVLAAMIHVKLQKLSTNINCQQGMILLYCNYFSGPYTLSANALLHYQIDMIVMAILSSEEIGQARIA
jgi:hypothetical protein